MCNAVDYYSATKKKEIPMFVTTWLEPKDIILSEIRWKKTNITWYHFYVKLKQLNSYKRNRKVIARA